MLGSPEPVLTITGTGAHDDWNRCSRSLESLLTIPESVLTFRWNGRSRSPGIRSGDAFDRWFRRKADEEAYVCTEDVTGQLLAFLYIKTETQEENYSDLSPTFTPAKRLKIGTFKVVANGVKLGERFLKIVFDCLGSA